MRITVLAIGTRGDVQPLTALAAGLQQAGHAVLVASTAEFEALITAHGLAFFALPGSAGELMQGTALRESMGGSRNPITLLRGIRQTLRAEFVRGLAAAWEACAEADVVIVSLLGFYAGWHVAEKRGIPLVEGYVLPARPTRAFPSPVLGVARNLGGPLNRASHLMLQRLAWTMLQPIANHARAEVLNLPPVRLGKVFAELDRVESLVLYGYSPEVLPKPDDWHAGQHVTGYWYLDHPDAWEPPQALVEFIAAGPKPVAIGFGSMTGTADPARVARVVIEALRQSGRRGVLLTGWGALEAVDVPKDVFVIDAVPHDWLFPQMAAVVHHGGSGTTGAGLRAGVPSILVPFGGDQYLWGQRVRKLGVGPQPIPYKRLTADRLAEAIRQAVGSVIMHDRAAALGECIRTEDGVGRAMALLEEALG